MPTGNKGEWSELYAFLYALIMRALREEGDNTINFITKLSRFECACEKEYTFDGEYIITPENVKIEAEELKAQLPIFLKEIKKGRKSFSCLELERVMETLGIEKIKSAASNKDDLKIQFKGSSKLRGFNVKSELGSCAGIINASRRTNFLYEVFCNSSREELNSLGGPKTIVRTIYERGGHLEFRKCHDIYGMQLGSATDIFALLLLEYFKSDEKMVSKLVDQIFGFKKSILNLPKEIWKREIQRILTDSGTFIQPAKIKTNDCRTASGGLLFVKNSGEVTCDIYSSKDDAGLYLYKVSFIDTASTTRHDFGRIYIEPDLGYKAIKLNLNIKVSN